METRTKVGLLVGCGLLASGAVVAPALAAQTPSAPQIAYTQTDLFFGTARPGGGPSVTDAQFQRFLDGTVTPAFPDGLTVDEGRGQYRDRFGTIEKERSYQVILLYPTSGAAAADTRIERIRRAYEHRFQQESVGRVDEPVHASFS